MIGKNFFHTKLEVLPAQGDHLPLQLEAAPTPVYFIMLCMLVVIAYLLLVLVFALICGFINLATNGALIKSVRNGFLKRITSGKKITFLATVVAATIIALSAVFVFNNVFFTSRDSIGTVIRNDVAKRYNVVFDYGWDSDSDLDSGSLATEKGDRSAHAITVYLPGSSASTECILTVLGNEGYAINCEIQKQGKTQHQSTTVPLSKLVDN